MKTIKRYPNRLLYDSEIKSFVKGEQLKAYIYHGIDFEIIDNRSGKDMTIPVLSNILVDDLNNKKNKKSVVETLRGFIALGGGVSMEILKKTILASIGVFEITKSKAEEVVDMLIKQGEVAKSKRSDAVLELLEKAEKSGKDLKNKVCTDVENTIAKMKVAKKNDLEDLTKKVDQLTEQMSALMTKLEGQE